MCLHSFIEYNKNLYQEQKEFTSSELQELLYKSVPVLRQLVNDPTAAIVAISTHANRAMTSYLSLTSSRKSELIDGRKPSSPSPPPYPDPKQDPDAKRVNAKKHSSLTARQSRMPFGEVCKLAFPTLVGSHLSPRPSNLSFTGDVSHTASPNLSPHQTPIQEERPHEQEVNLRPIFSRQPRALYSGPKVTLVLRDEKSKIAKPKGKISPLPVPHIVCDDDEDYVFTGSAGLITNSNVFDSKFNADPDDYAPIFSASAPAVVGGMQKEKPPQATGGLLGRPSTAILAGFSAPQRAPNLFPRPSPSANFGGMPRRVSATRESLDYSLPPFGLPSNSEDDNRGVSRPSSGPSIRTRPSAGKLSAQPIVLRGTSLASMGTAIYSPRSSKANIFGRMQSSHRQMSPSKLSVGGRSILSRQSSQRFGQSPSRLMKGSSVSRFGRMTPAGMSRIAAASQSVLKPKGFYDSPSGSFDIDDEEYMVDNEFSRCVTRERLRMSALDDFTHKLKMRFNSVKHRTVTGSGLTLLLLLISVAALSLLLNADIVSFSCNNVYLISVSLASIRFT